MGAQTKRAWPSVTGGRWQVKGHGSKFDRKKQEAIAALLANKSMEDAARAIGVSPNTLSRWMKEEDFLAGLEEARQMVHSQAMDRLRDASGVAASTVLKIMIDPTAPAPSRLKAAEIVLDKSEVTESFEHRMAKLEAILQSLLKSPAPLTVAKHSTLTPLLSPPVEQTQIAAETNGAADQDESHTERLAS